MSIYIGASEIKDIYVGEGMNDYSAMQGPAPDGFHVPLNTEWQAVHNVWTALGGGGSEGTNFGIALKLPFAGTRSYSSADVYGQGSSGCYWSSSLSDTNFAYRLYFDLTSLYPKGTSYRTYGYSVRCFKDTPVIPTSYWTKLYGTSIESGGIFWSSADGLISLSSDGQTWITIMDKNLGATTVWNSGDTLSEANCGTYFQWGNNYGFPFTGSVTTSSTRVDASTYGPGNYYSSSTYITYSGRWDSTDNGNLRGGETGVVKKGNVKEVFVGTTKVRPTGWQPGANTIAYYKLEEDLNDYSGNNRNLSVGGGTFSYSTLTSGKKYCVVNTSTYTNTLTIPFNKNAYTFSVWFNINAKSSSRAILTEVAAGSDYRPRVQTIGGNVSALTSLDSTGVSWVSGQWYYATVTYENGTAKCYINGSLVGTKTFSGSATSGTFYINPSNAYYRAGGGITELIIENKTRTSQEIADYYNLTKGNY